jgi:uncharacterized protein
MTKAEILKRTREYVKKIMSDEATGHDWYHIERVIRNARLIGKKEKADLFIIELAALLHDIADWKFHKDPNAGVKLTRSWLTKLKVDKKINDQVCYIVQNISFKGGANNHRMTTVEGKVVQDADRLDALGAIGIARAFAYGGYKGKPIHDPKIAIMTIKDSGDLQKYKDKGTTINHFYEKILWLADLMNTKTGYKLAIKREQYVKNFLKQFYKEWEGKI